MLWKKLLLWLAAEILLTFLGLDDFADYGEYVFDKPAKIVHQQNL